jgi:allantoicase
MSDFTKLVNLAAERLGARVLAASDEFFAPKENLLKAEPPVWAEGKYTERGKWMDGWETRRRRDSGHDWCVVRMATRGVVRGMAVDTSYFKGNFPAECSLEGCAFDAEPKPDELAAAGWAEIIPPAPLAGDTVNVIPARTPAECTHLRFHIYPDGGVARLRVHGHPAPDWPRLADEHGLMDLAEARAGGLVATSSDEFFGRPENLLLPGPPLGMADGWETRRRRGPGHDWAAVRLGACAVIYRVGVDTTYFKGNFPDSCSLDMCRVEGDATPPPPGDAGWQPVVDSRRLKANCEQWFEVEAGSVGPASHVRLNIFPDGGVARLRVLGVPEPWMEGLRRLNLYSPGETRAALTRCCGSSRWVNAMLELRPFRTPPQLFALARAQWQELAREDWIEAFSHHPQIGETRAARESGAEAERWSQQEQAGAQRAFAQVREPLLEANRLYQIRFGFLFVIYATGKSAAEILAALEERLKHSRETELRIAAAEQLRITQLRLGKLLEAAGANHH